MLVYRRCTISNDDKKSHQTISKSLSQWRSYVKRYIHSLISCKPKTKQNKKSIYFIWLFTAPNENNNNNRQSNSLFNFDSFSTSQRHFIIQKAYVSHFNKYSKSLNKYQILFIFNIIYVLFEEKIHSMAI